MKKLFIIGSGPGRADLITPKAREVISSCDLLIGTSRVGENFPGAVLMSISEIIAALEENSHEVTGILVSGDAGFFSMSNKLRRKFSDKYKIETVNGLNCVQYLAGRLELRYDDVPVYSVHGRDGSLAGRISYCKRLFALTGGANNAREVCRKVTEAGLGHVRVWAGENLSYENERIISGSASELAEINFDDLTVLLFQNHNPADIYIGLRDEDFIRGHVPMTKEEVRAVVLSKMNIRPGDIVYDIGAGTGSLTVASAYRAWEGTVYGVEMDEDAFKLACENRDRLRAFNIEMIFGKAPKALKDLPDPDVVFIGGSSGNLREIIECCREKNPDARIVVSAVTLQTINEIVSIGAAEIVSVNIARALHVAKYDLLQGQNPVYVAIMK